MENVSDEMLEFEIQMSVLQYVNLIVTGPTGASVSVGHYGDRFSPLAALTVFRLNPGEKFTAVVSLLGTVPKSNQTPGRYVVRAVFDYQQMRAASEPLVVEIFS